MNDDTRALLGDRTVIASVSGGKDSAAMSLWLSEQGIEHRRVFMDTGWEHPKTYEYLREVLPKYVGPIEWIRAELQMRELVQKKGIFPSRVRRFCTQLLKVKPFARFVEDFEVEIVNAVGIRAGESESRSRMPEWEWDEAVDCHVWRPILRWSVDDVVAIHKRHGLPPNPLYLLGASRVGCWPCIFARKSEIRLVADTDPERIAEIRTLEAEVGAVATERAAKKGERVEQPPHFFQSRSGTRVEDGRVVHDGACIPIDDVVTWSRTSRGGRQFEMFADPSDGCMRWGMCDTTGEDE